MTLFVTCKRSELKIEKQSSEQLTHTFYGESFQSKGYNLLGVSVITVKGEWRPLDHS